MACTRLVRPRTTEDPNEGPRQAFIFFLSCSSNQLPTLRDSTLTYPCPNACPSTLAQLNRRPITPLDQEQIFLSSSPLALSGVFFQGGNVARVSALIGLHSEASSGRWT